MTLRFDRDGRGVRRRAAPGRRAGPAALHRAPGRAHGAGRGGLPDGVRRAPRARWPRPPPGCISPPRCWPRWTRRGSRRRRHAACRRRHLPADARRTRRRTACTPSAARSIRPRPRRIRRGRRVVGGGHHHAAPAGNAAARTACAPFAARPTSSSARASASARRPAADQFPPAALDAVHAGLRLRRHRAHAGGLRPCHRRRLPLLFLRRCQPAGARARDPSAGPCRRRTAAARAGLLHTAHGDVATPVFMPVGTAGTVKAMTADAVRATGAGSCWATPTT